VLSPHETLPPWWAALLYRVIYCNCNWTRFVREGVLLCAVLIPHEHLAPWWIDRLLQADHCNGDCTFPGQAVRWPKNLAKNLAPKQQQTKPGQGEAGVHVRACWGGGTVPTVVHLAGGGGGAVPTVGRVEMK
jgi:hypothetical protein